MAAEDQGLLARIARKSAKLAVALVLVAAALAALWTLLAYNWSYSRGERVGYAQKISTKGWLCTTWEGELAMVSLPGQMSEKFEYTVRDDAVAQRISALLSQRVVLVYEEHRGLPTSCFGETAYFVTDVRPADAVAP